jgi:hypothetical protein
MTFMRALDGNRNAASAFRLRETLSAPDLQPLSNSLFKKPSVSAAFKLLLIADCGYAPQ